MPDVLKKKQCSRAEQNPSFFNPLLISEFSLFNGLLGVWAVHGSLCDFISCFYGCGHGEMKRSRKDPVFYNQFVYQCVRTVWPFNWVNKC